MPIHGGRGSTMQKKLTIMLAGKADETEAWHGQKYAEFGLKSSDFSYRLILFSIMQVRIRR